jgi:hypothetical protein
MAQPFANLPLILSRRQREMIRLVNGVTQKAALAGAAYLIRETPVKRGIARSNWVTSVDQRFSAVIPAYSPYPALDNGPAPISMKQETANASAAIAQNIAATAPFDCRRNKTVFIQNNADHIAKLNQGHSAQSAAGWFDRCADVAKAGIRGMWRLKP